MLKKANVHSFFVTTPNNVGFHSEFFDKCKKYFSNIKFYNNCFDKILDKDDYNRE